MAIVTEKTDGDRHRVQESNLSEVDIERTAITIESQTPDKDVSRRITTVTSGDAPFSVFTIHQKRFIVFMASVGGIFSAISANIYLPALVPLSEYLHVSYAMINLTITTYMIFQGIAPSLVGALADQAGRRPAYTVCFVIYIGANIGLALQSSYAALLILRCVQSSGSSATIAMASAVVSDIATPAERGSYMGFTLAGSLLGPAVGPVIGGILAQFLGWRAIFWFLTISASIFLIVFLVFFPETSRRKVGNGAIPPEGWNMSLLNYLALRKARREGSTIPEDEKVVDAAKSRFPNPLASLKILLDKQVASLLIYNALFFCAFYDVAAIIPAEFTRIFHFNDLQIGLCFIPYGGGSMVAALVTGQLLDFNFKRWCRKLNIEIKKGRDMDLSDFPIERVRLEVALPAVYSCSALILIWGWVLDIDGPLAALLVILFFTSFTMSIAFNVTSTLLVDFFPRRAATATAANNLVRCLLGAGATAVIVPMIDAMGRGWCFTLIALILMLFSPLMLINLIWGRQWRRQRKERDENNSRKEGGNGNVRST